MGTVPIPQGATIGEAEQKMVPIPEGATVGEHADDHSGFWNALKDDLVGAAKSLPSMLPPVAAYQSVRNAIDEVKSLKQTGKTLEQQHTDEQRKAGYGAGYRALTPVAEGLGVNVKGMEQSASQGDSAGVLGHAALPAALAASPLAIEGAARLGSKVAPKLSEALPSFPKPQVAVMDMGKMPAKAVSGIEDVFRASAPTGTKIGFRENVVKAAGDLAEIGQKINMSEAKGGIINPDMRVRATVKAIDEHLGEMYQNERAAQIEPHGNDPVKFQPTQDAVEGLKYLSRSAGDNITRTIAGKAANGGQLTIAETDALAQTANQYLKGFESMTAAEKAQASMTNRRMGGLKELDRSLSQTLNDELRAKGEPGLYAYERRYAALSEIKQQLERRMNAVELQQTGAIGAVSKVTRPLAKIAGAGIKEGIASASQAAVADVNIGRMLQRGMKSLADSGLKPERPTTSQASRP
jgi:hypothetical protein